MLNDPVAQYFIRLILRFVLHSSLTLSRVFARERRAWDRYLACFWSFDNVVLSPPLYTSAGFGTFGSIKGGGLTFRSIKGGV